MDKAQFWKDMDELFANAKARKGVICFETIITKRLKS